MEDFFSRILEISLSGSIIVLAVLVLRLVLRNAPKRAVCLLWMLAVLRLLVPFQIESDWSLQPEPPEFAQPARQEYFDSGPVTPQTVPPEILEDAVEYPVQQPTVQESEPTELLPWLWLAGAGVLAVHGLISYIRLKRRVRDAAILEEGVWISPGLDTAFVLGFFRPQIYLPVLDPEERELVLRHERQHIRRLDHWWKLLAYAAVTIHWFNPLAWVTYILLCRDMELACDQETVRGMDSTTRKAYSAALLRCAVKRSGIAACPVAFGEISVKERIMMIVNYKKPGFWVTVLALIAAVAVGLLLLTSPKELTDLERCEQGLRQWQELDDYRLRVDQSVSGDGDSYQIEYWSSGGEHLQQFRYAGELSEWRHWKDGRAYEFGSGDGGWHGGDYQESAVIPWIMGLDWDALTVHSCESADVGKTVLLTVDFPVLGNGTMTFRFDDDGKLSMVSRTFTDGTSSVITDTTELVETDREKIGEDMRSHGAPAELARLYSELERIQGMEYVHLIVDAVDDSDYPGWDTARQEFIRCGEDYYRNYDVKNSGGTMTTTYLKYGGVLYAREYSDEGLVPNRDWEQITDRGFGEYALLDRDWSGCAVLDIQSGEDGSAVVTIQGNLDDADEYTTYYSKSFEFHLDPDGRLTTHVYYGHYRQIVDDYFAQGTYERRQTTTTHILDTPEGELRERIQKVRREAAG